MSDDIVPIVLDNGTSILKAGFALENRPRVSIPALVARPKYLSLLTDRKADQIYLGQEAINMRGVCRLKYPTKYGVVSEPENLFRLWDQTIRQGLLADVKNHPVLVTEATMTAPVNREVLAAVLFECMEVPAVYVCYQSVLALYASARTTGLVIECGEGTTCVTPVYDAYHIRSATRFHPVAGRMITNYLRRLLSEVGCRFSTTAEHEIVREIKERTCYVALDFDKEAEHFAKREHQVGQTYVLPDGQKLDLNTQPFYAAEVLFNSRRLGFDFPGLPEIVRSSIEACPKDSRKDLLGNIVLSGGTTMLKGFTERLRQDIQSLGTTHVPVNLSAPPDRINQVWIGGSILASLKSFHPAWITKKQYDEVGPRILYQY